MQQWPAGTLMARAGRRMASWTLAQAPHAQRVWVAAGPGGNGGDGLHAAAHLARMGRQVAITLHTGDRDLSPDTQAALQLALGAGCRLMDHPVPGWADLAIDALLGLGANRPLGPGMAAAVRLINEQLCPCLSIDIPTGLNADTGQPLGGGLIQALATLSLLTLKPGLLMASGRDAAGRVWLDRLADPPAGKNSDPVARTVRLPPAPRAGRVRPHASHKGRFGDVILVGGAAGMAGALRLAAHAALAAGAGRVIAAALDPALPLHDELRPECMWSRPDDLPHFPLEQATVVCGCGGAEAVSQWLPLLLERSWRLVLDADALNAVARRPVLAVALRYRHHQGRTTVLTPHPLEAARLLDCTGQDIQADRLRAARHLSSQYASTVLLKGSGTVIVTPGLLPEVNVTGNAALATGGTGDVLAGWLAGRWASEAPQDANESVQAHRMACDAAHMHGLAADHHGASNALRASDLVELMGRLVS